jgi:hypothetical protein
LGEITHVIGTGRALGGRTDERGVGPWNRHPVWKGPTS